MRAGLVKETVKTRDIWRRFGRMGRSDLGGEGLQAAGTVVCKVY